MPKSKAGLFVWRKLHLCETAGGVQWVSMAWYEEEIGRLMPLFLQEHVNHRRFDQLAAWLLSSPEWNDLRGAWRCGGESYARDNPWLSRKEHGALTKGTHNDNLRMRQRINKWCIECALEHQF